MEIIIGVKGISLDYVIRQIDMPDLFNKSNWEWRARLAAPHAENIYRPNALAVHGVILRNITESLDAYTYVKTNIRWYDGMVDITELIARYENAATQHMHINEAKKTLANIAYRNEWAITFEKFVATFQKAIDDLEIYGCGMQNGDIVDLLWTKIGNPELASYVVSMKVHYKVVKRGYWKILQDIATQIPLSRASDLHQTDVTTEGGGCPEKGAHTADGTLFTGTYTYKK